VIRLRRGLRLARVRHWVALAALAVLGAGLSGVWLVAAGSSTKARAPARPNVVVVMTDDQTVSDMSVMPNVQRLIGARGATFQNSFVNYPLCCPSRATFLTGQYAHNHGVLTGHAFGDLDNSSTLPVWLHDNGYHTGHVGRYLPGYGRAEFGGPRYVPPGWSEWYAAPLPTDLDVYDYDLNENGTLVHYGSAPSQYKGKVLTQTALDFINENAPAPEPFFLSIAYTAPHVSPSSDPTSRAGCDNAAVPAPVDLGAFATEPLPRPPSFGEADVSDKPEHIAARPQLTSDRVAEITRSYRCRLESLQHVDRGVAQMVRALRSADELGQTLFIFTSDNGFFAGQHRIPTGKIDPYEEAIRVPLLMRGPGVPTNRNISALAVNADISRTILDVAAIAPGKTQDGLSLYRLITDPGRVRDVLIESNTVAGFHAPYKGVRTSRYVYVENSTGELELYDLTIDPYQLENRVFDPAYAEPLAWLQARLAQLRDCRGASCRTSVGVPPPPSDPPPVCEADCNAPSSNESPSLDTVPPATRLDKRPKKNLTTQRRTRRVKFTFSADELSSFRCRLDKRDWRPCSSPKHVRIGKGHHTFRVAAVDGAGNRDATPARWRGRLRLGRRH
jgi:N-acetylglucosamine-6-sulfatase